MKKAIIAIVLGVASLGAVAAYASTYEWIKYLEAPNPIYSNTAVTTTWGVVTQGPYYEYRSLYYATTTGVWNEFTACRHEGTVNGQVDDSCAPTYPTFTTSTNIELRATTNYSSCGTWTPTPDETNCGSSFTRTITILP